MPIPGVKFLFLKKELVVKKGCLAAYNLTVSALEDEDYIIHAGITDDGRLLDSDQCMRLLSIPVITGKPLNAYSLNIKALDDIRKKNRRKFWMISQPEMLYFLKRRWTSLTSGQKTKEIL